MAVDLFSDSAITFGERFRLLGFVNEEKGSVFIAIGSALLHGCPWERDSMAVCLSCRGEVSGAVTWGQDRHTAGNRVRNDGERRPAQKFSAR